MLKKITTSGGGKIITVKGEKMLSEEIYKVMSYHNIVKLFQARGATYQDHIETSLIFSRSDIPKYIRKEVYSLGCASTQALGADPFLPSSVHCRLGPRCKATKDWQR